MYLDLPQFANQMQSMGSETNIEAKSKAPVEA
jgi:hypothetical protein